VLNQKKEARVRCAASALHTIADSSQSPKATLLIAYLLKENADFYAFTKSPLYEQFGGPEIAILCFEKQQNLSDIISTFLKQPTASPPAHLPLPPYFVVGDCRSTIQNLEQFAELIHVSLSCAHSPRPSDAHVTAFLKRCCELSSQFRDQCITAIQTLMGLLQMAFTRLASCIGKLDSDLMAGFASANPRADTSLQGFPGHQFRKELLLLHSSMQELLRKEVASSPDVVSYRHLLIGSAPGCPSAAGV